MEHTLKLKALVGGGLLLGYRCSARCRHCLYGCGPHRLDGRPNEAELDVVLDLLATRAPMARFHIGGGEPFLDLPLLGAAVAGMRERNLVVDYVETNSSWVRSEQHACDTLADLGRRGLRCVLVSMSPFHAEHVPFERTLWLMRAAQRTLPDGAFPWTPEFLPELAAHPPTRPIDLEETLGERGHEYALSLAERYGLVPAGRSGRYLHRHGQRHPWEQLLDQAPCPARLRDTTHFHVDGQGRYVPGLCPGLVLPLAELPGPLDLEQYPVVATLLQPGGLGTLVKHARSLGFEPRDTYSAACDLCTHLLLFLHEHEPTADLGPEGFYDRRSVPEFWTAAGRPGACKEHDVAEDERPHLRLVQDAPGE